MAVKFERRNEFYKGIISGLTGAVSMYITIFIFDFLNIVKFNLIDIALDVIMVRNTGSLAVTLLAWLMILLTGGFFGIGMAFLFSKIFTSKLYLLKGIFYGLLIWVLNFGFLYRVFIYPPELSRRIPDNLIFLLSYSVYGLVTAYMLKRTGIFEIKN